MNGKHIWINASLALLSLLAIYYLVFNQYHSYKTNTELTRQKLTLNTLKGRIVYLDEALTMSARLYVSNGTLSWKNRYKVLEKDYLHTTAEIFQRLPTYFDGKTELESAGAKLFEIENNAFQLIDEGETEAANNILFSNKYDALKQQYSLGLQKLNGVLDDKVNQLMIVRRNNFIQDTIIIVSIALVILTGCFLFISFTRKWNNRYNELSANRTLEAIKAAKELDELNSKLRVLSTHLIEIREKERKVIAYEISEEVAQQIASAKLKLSIINEEMLNSKKDSLFYINHVESQLTTSLNYLRNLAFNVYPSTLKDLGLIDALAWESERLEKQLNATINFHSLIDHVEVNEFLANNIFRIYQLKLTNLCEQSGKSINVTIYLTQGDLCISIDHYLSRTKSTKQEIDHITIEEQLQIIGGRIELDNHQEQFNTLILVPLIKQNDLMHNLSLA